MQTRKKLTVACLILLGCGAATVCNAQLTLHLVADLASTGVTTAGDPVASWTDSSASGFDVSATTPAQPTFGLGDLNGQGYVSFDGVDDMLSRPSVASSTFLPGEESATMIVLRPDGLGQDSMLAWNGSLANMWQLSQAGTTPTQIYYVHGQLANQVSAPVPGNWVGNWHVLTAVRNSDDSGEIRLNGVTVATSTAFVGPLTSASQTLTVGGSNFDGVNDRWAGDIAEVRVYSTVPSDLNAIELELGGTYGLSVVPEPSEYAMIFGLACVGGALALRYRRQTSMAS